MTMPVDEERRRSTRFFAPSGDGANCRRPRDGSLSFVKLSLSLLQQISHHERAAYLLDQPTIAKVSKIND